MIILKKNFQIKSRVRSIHSSLAIEANSLSLEFVENIIDNKLVLGDRKEIQEVKNANELYEHIDDYNPKSESDFLKAHTLMMKYFDDDNGFYRDHGEGVKKGNQIIYMAPESMLVPTLMNSLFDFINCNEGKIHPLILLSIFHYYFVYVHPFSDYYGTYKALEDLYKEWKIKAIGVSNFYPDRLADMCLFGREVIPAVNQVETNPMNQQIKAEEVMNKYGVHIEAWAPFGEGKNGMFTNETLVNIGKKYGKSAAQVILRWLIQRGVIIACKSTHIERMKENFDVFDFELSKEDMEEIRKLDSSDSLFFNHQDPDMVEWFDKMVKQRRESDDFRKEKNW